MSINLYKKRTKNGQPVLEELLSKDSATVADKPLVYDSTNNNVKSADDLNVNSVTASCFHGPLDGTAKNATCFNNKTYAEACADILSGCAADSNKLNGKTYSEVCADILSGTAANATCFNGCTYAQACTDIRDGLATQTCANDIQNCADFIQSCVTAIESKIPAQASASNQLADKDFVNSSITTNTANFRGTYACVAELPSTGNTNNDYAFVCSLNTTTGNYIYDRYKWVASDSCWVCEYELNTTGFTAEQLASINSGITSNLVAKITDVYDNTVTVCMNGECKGSFNLNQNTDVCIDLGSSIRNATCFNGKTYSEVCSDILSGTANNARNLVGSNGCVKLAADCVTVCESNTYLGKRTNNAIGNGNTAVGCAALDTSCTTERNTAIGRNALVETCGNCNVAVGHNAGAFSELNESVSIGHMAGCSSSGRCNVAIGEWSLCKESGSNNTAIGSGTHTANRNKSGTVTIGSGVTAQCNYQAVIGYCDKCCLTFNMCNGTLTAACFDGNAASADNATCFNGCTYACAKEDIRNGMAAAISIGDSCPYQADGNRVVHIPAYPPDLSSCDGLDCTGTVTQVKVGTTAYDPVSGVVSLPEYPTIPTTIQNATCFNGCTYAQAKADIRNYKPNCACCATKVDVSFNTSTTPAQHYLLIAGNYPEGQAYSVQSADCLYVVPSAKRLYTYNLCSFGCAELNDVCALNLKVYNDIEGNIQNAWCFSGRTYDSAKADIRNYTPSLATCATCVARCTATTGTCYLALFGANTASTGTNLYVSSCKQIAFCPATGILSTCCVKGISALIAGNPIGCSSTVLGQAGTTVSSGSLELYKTTPLIDFHVNNATADFTQRISAECGVLNVCVNNGTGCTAATRTANFDFCSNGTFKATCFDGTINMNCVADAASTNVAANSITRKTILRNQITNVGYITSAAIGLCRGTSGFGQAVLSVSCNDAGSVWKDYCFNNTGRISANGLTLHNNGGINIGVSLKVGTASSNANRNIMFTPAVPGSDNTSTGEVQVSSCCPLTYNPSTGLLCSSYILAEDLCSVNVCTDGLYACGEAHLGAQCNICIYDGCGNDFICAWCNNLTIGYNSSDFVNDSHECCRITIGLNNHMCAGTDCADSVVIGYCNWVCWPGSGNLSFIYGYYNTTKDGGLAIGGWNYALGECSVALGWDNSAEEYSIAIGIGSYAVSGSTAIGCDASASGLCSIAIGYESRAECCCVIAIGRHACSFIDNGLSIGCEATTEVIKRSGTTEIFGCVLSDIHRGDYRDVAIHSSSNIMQCELYKAIADRIDLSKDLATQCICTIPDINCSLLVRGRYNNLGITSIQHQKYSGFCNLILTLSDNSMASISSVGSNVITAPVYLEVTGLSV